MRLGRLQTLAAQPVCAIQKEDPMPKANLYVNLLRNAAEASRRGNLGSVGLSAYLTSEEVPWTMLTPEDIRKLAAKGRPSYDQPGDVQALPRVTASSPTDRGVPSIVQSPQPVSLAAPPALPIRRRPARIARVVAHARDEKAFLDA